MNDPRSREEVEKKFGVTDRYAWMGFGQECGSIVARDGKAAVVFDNSPVWDCDNLGLSRWRTTDGVMHLRLEEPLLFFIPDTAKDPRGRTGEEVWVLATIPRIGPPRPIVLGIKKVGAEEIQRIDLD